MIFNKINNIERLDGPRRLTKRYIGIVFPFSIFIDVPQTRHIPTVGNYGRDERHVYFARKHQRSRTGPPILAPKFPLIDPVLPYLP